MDAEHFCDGPWLPSPQPPSHIPDTVWAPGEEGARHKSDCQHTLCGMAYVTIQRLLSDKLFQGLRGYLPGAGQRSGLKTFETCRILSPTPAEVTLQCT
jgi:hypothetical protein